MTTSALERKSPGSLLEVPPPQQLSDLRALLSVSGFTVPAVCQRAGIDSIYDFRSIREGRTVALDLQDRLDLLIRLFMDVELVDRGVVERFLTQEGVATLDNLGLLRPSEADARLCHASVLLYPT